MLNEATVQTLLRLLAKDKRNWKCKVLFYSVFMWHVYVIWWGASAKNDLSPLGSCILSFVRHSQVCPDGIHIANCITRL